MADIIVNDFYFMPVNHDYLQYWEIMRTDELFDVSKKE